MNSADRDSGIFPREHLTPELRLALQAARREVLETVLRYVRWAALAAFVGYALTALWSAAWGSVVVYGVLFVVLFGLSLARGLSLAWRGGVFVALLYGAALVSLVTLGLGGSARVFLITYTMLTTILFGTRAGVWSGVLSLATWFGAGAVFSGLQWEPVAAPTSLLWVDWISAGLVLLMLIVASVLPQRQFLETQVFALSTSEQKRDLERAREVLTRQKTELEAASHQLTQANRDLREQSAALERRISQLGVSAEVARVAATLHDLPTLLETAVALISERFGYYHAGIFLLDEEGEWAVLRAANSEGGRRMLARRHRLRVGQQGIVGFVTAMGQPRIALNVGEDAVHFRNPDLPDTQSEMALPLRGRVGVIGALDVQSVEVNAFSDDDIAVLQTLADQLAVAIENAQLFLTKERSLEELRLVQSEARQQSQAMPVSTLPQAYRYDGVDTAPVPAEDVRPEPGALEIPIRVGADTLGTIALRREGLAWTEADLEFSRAIAERMGLALENARLYFDARNNAQRMTALSEAALELTGPQFNLNDLLPLIARRARQLLRADSADLWLPVSNLEEIELRVTYPTGPPALLGRRLARGEGLAGRAYATGHTATLDDYQTQPGQMTALAVPLIWQNETLGVLAVNRLQPDWRYTAEDETVARLFAAAAASALSNARLLEETRRRIEELQTINSISTILSSQADLYVMLRLVGNKVLEIFGVQSGYIALYDSRTNLIEFPYFLENGMPAPTPPVPLGRGPSSVVIQTRRPLLINDNALQRMEALGAYLQGTPALSFLSVPIVVGDDVIGILNVQSTTHEGLFDTNDERLLSIIAANVGVAIENSRLFQQTQNALAETEGLYQASAELNTAQSFADVLAILRRHTLLRHAQVMQLHYFERPWTSRFAPEWSEVLAHWSATGAEAPVLQTPVASWLAQALRVDLITVVDDTANDIRLHDAARALYRTRFEAHSAAFVPLVLAGDWIGYVAGFYQEGAVFPEAELRRLMSLTQQAAALVENLRGITVIERRAQQLSALNRLAEAASSNLELTTILNSVCREIVQTFNARNSGIALLNAERTALVVMADYSSAVDEPSAAGVEIPLLDNPSSQRVIETRRPLVVAEAQSSVLTRPIHDLMRQRQTECLMIVPLIVRGEVIGTIGIDSGEPNRLFTDSEIALAETMAGQISSAVENSRLYQQTQRRAQQLLTAAEVSRVATSLLNEDELIRQSVELIRARFNLYYTALFLTDERREWAVLRYASGGAPDAAALLLRQGHQLEVGGQSMIGWAVVHRQARIADDVAAETVRYANPLTPETRSEMALPLAVGDEVLGAISVQATQRNAFAEADIAVLQTIADQVAASLQNARLFERVRHQEWSASALARLAQAVSGKLEEVEVWEALAGELLDTFKADGVVIYRWAAAEQTFTPRVVLCEPEAAELLHWPTPGTPTDLTRHPELLPAVEDRTPHVHRFGPVGDNQLREGAAIPLVIDQMVDSVVQVVHTGPPTGLTPEDLALLASAVRSAESALQIARLYALQRETAERLQEVDRLKSQFLANMSHELRTPLNSIIGFSRVILKGIDGPVNDIQRQDLGSIYNSGQHLLGLINDILDLSRIEAGKMELSFEEVQLGEILEGVISTTRGLVRDKPIELHKRVPEDLPTVRADSTRVRQVLLNLLSNAAKFTDQGQIVLQAQVVQTDDQEFVQISVSDTGHGIPAHEMPKLFERFSQVDGSPTRKAGGTGLGLNISRHLVDLHGGRIWGESDGVPGHGTTFRFTLPVWQKGRPAEAQDGRPIVLVIEDDTGIAGLYRRYLEPHGYHVLAAPGDANALTRAIECQPRVILLDVLIPTPQGWQLLAALKAEAKTQAIPVIMCTLTNEREQALQLGAADYLLKPILESDLTRALNRLPALQPAANGRGHT